MIGDFDLEAPPIDDDLSQMVESHRRKTGQDYAAILFFGLWGTADCSAEVRLYAGYRHLADNAGDGPAWLEVARVHLELGEIAESEKIVDELVRHDNPGLYPQLYNEDPEVQRAYTVAESGSPERAIELLDGLKIKHDDSPVYHFFLGSLLHETGDAIGAAAEYRLAASALKEFEEELEREDYDIDPGVDFREAERFLGVFLEAADLGREPPFIARPLDLSDFREE